MSYAGAKSFCLRWVIFEIFMQRFRKAILNSPFYQMVAKGGGVALPKGSYDGDPPLAN